MLDEKKKKYSWPSFTTSGQKTFYVRIAGSNEL